LAAAWHKKGVIVAKELTKVQNGVAVALDYTLKLADGEVVDSSEGRQPLEFIQGTGGLVPGFANAVHGMKLGEEKDFEVTPEQGYGAYNPEANMLVPPSAFPSGMVPQVGMSLHVQGAKGQMMPATIMEIDKRGILLDLNHALAGKTLYFHVKILALREPTEEELQHGHVHH
jgi:FKBP-type peptidyl-prolyl cis-trans isomerase SlyD